MAALILVAATAVFVSAYDFSWAPWTGAGGDGVAPGNSGWTRYFRDVNGGAWYGGEITQCSSYVWGASIDDGPSVYTPGLLNYFQSKGGIKATFWLVGRQIPWFPDTAARTYQLGHQIGIHTWSHHDLTQLSDDQIVAELVYGARAIFEVTGMVPKYFRPPYGYIDDRVRRIAATMGLHAVKWSHDTDDWRYIGTGENWKVLETYKNWMNQGVGNAISLQHDNVTDTASVITQSMDILINAGRRIVPLSECIGDWDVHYNPTLANFFTNGAFDGRSSNSNSGQQQQQQPSWCQNGLVPGTDAWGVSGCILYNYCPSGGSWSVKDNKCNCLPETPIWDENARVCYKNSNSNNNPGLWCGQGFYAGTDAWGVYGCISWYNCPQGGSWSVNSNKCNCLPNTPNWDDWQKVCTSSGWWQYAVKAVDGPVAVDSNNSSRTSIFLGLGVVVGIAGAVFTVAMIVLRKNQRDGKEKEQEEKGDSNASYLVSH